MTMSRSCIVLRGLQCIVLTILFNIHYMDKRLWIPDYTLIYGSSLNCCHKVGTTLLSSMTLQCPSLIPTNLNSKFQYENSPLYKKRAP